MFTKPVKTDVHNRLNILKKRKSLSMEQQKILDRLNSGYEGETRFHHILQTQLRCNPIQLYNLHLNINGSECQIDCLLIFQNELILLEIKNYQGDFLIENNKWYTISKKGIKNPLHQLQRTELMVNQFLNENQTPLTVKSYLVFVHPEFQLYQAPLNLPLVFSTQLKRFIRKLQNIPSKTHLHHHFVQALKHKHLNKSAYESNIIYDYHDLKKGVTCEKCYGLMDMYNNQLMRCTICQYLDNIDQSVIKSINDFSALFPERKITMKGISDWLDYHVTDYRIRTVLSNNFQIAGKGRNTHYRLKTDTL